MSETNIELFLGALETIFGGSAIAGALVIGVALFFFTIFLLLSVGAVYYGALLWATYEREDGNKKVDEFDETEIFTTIGLVLSQLGAALGSVAALVASTASSVGATIAQNLSGFIALIFVFIGIVSWDTWHELAFEGFAEFSNCFLAPVVRTLIYPVLNLGSLALGGLYPVINFLRHLIVSITTETIIDSLICAGEQTIVLLEFASATLVTFSLALLRWFQSANAALNVAPDFFPTGELLGRTIASLDEFFFCACNTVTEIVLRPFFEVFRTPNFAELTNATLNAFPLIPFIPFSSLVFLSQGIARPIVDSVEANSFVRPSFNSTFDVYSDALVNGGEVLDEFGVALFNVTLNIVREAVSACPSRAPWSARGRCSDNDPINTGICSDLGLCLSRRAIVNGCCVVPGLTQTQCFPADTLVNCAFRDVASIFRSGVQCAQDTRCTVPTGCCQIARLLNGSATTCTDDLTAVQCASFPNSVLAPRQMCSQLPNGRCLSQSPLAILPNQEAPCGTCTAPGGTCQCSGCICPYEVDTTPADANSTLTRGFNLCTDGTEPDGGDPGNPEAVCRVPVSLIDEQPPVPGFFAAVANLIDTVYVQTWKYGWNIVWNIDVVFSTRNGFHFLRIHDTISRSARAANDALHAVFDWLARLTLDIGDQIADHNTRIGTLSSRNKTSLLTEFGKPSRSALKSVQALTVKQKLQLDAKVNAIEDIIKDAFLIVSTIIKVIGDFIAAVAEAIISLVEFSLDLTFGSAWTTISTGFGTGTPDFFAYAKDLFGDNTAPGTVFRCAMTVPGNPEGKLMFTGHVTSRVNTTCNDRGEILQYCRFLFQRAVAEPQNITFDQITDTKPEFIEFDEEETDFVPFVQVCHAQVENCISFVIPRDPGTGGDNQFELLLAKFVAIGTALDPLVNVWCGTSCTEAPELRAFFTGFLEPLAIIVMVPIDFVVHLDLIITTPYLACLDVEGALNAVTEFVSNLSDVGRLINRLFTGTPCARGASARDPRIFCALSQMLDSVFDLFVEAGILLWHVAQTLIRILDGIMPNDALLDTLAFDRVEIPIRNFLFGAFSIVLQVIPESVKCAGSLSATSGCCVVLPFQTLPQALCLPRQTVESCGHMITSRFSFVTFPANALPAILFPNTSCPDAMTQTSLTCASSITDPSAVDFPIPQPGGAVTSTQTLTYGCCKTVLSHPLPGLEDVANTCVDDSIQELECAGDDNIFFANQLCADTAGKVCPPFGDVVQEVIAQGLSTIVADFVIIIPRIVFEGIIKLAEVVVDQSEEAVRQLIFAILEPFFEIVSDLFRQAASVTNCAGSSTLANGFIAISNFIEQELCSIVDFVTDGLLAIVFFFFGIIQAIFKQTFDLLRLSLQFFLRLFVDFGFAVFQPETVCFVQDAVCSVSSGDNDANIDFAVNRCREHFVCAHPEVEWRFSCAPFGLDCPFASGHCIPSCSCTVAGAISNQTGIVCKGRCPEDTPTVSRSKVPPHNPLLSIKLPELRKRTTALPGAAFCGGFLATYGVENARVSTDSTARDCLEVMKQGNRDRFDEYYDLYTAISEQFMASWEKAPRFQAASDGEFTTRSVATLMYAVNDMPFKKYSQRTHAEQRAYVKARKGLWKTHSSELYKTIAIHSAKIDKHFADALGNDEHLLLKDWLKAHIWHPEPGHYLHSRMRPKRVQLQSNQTLLTDRGVLAVKMQVVVEATKNYFGMIAHAIEKRIMSFFGNIQDQQRQLSGQGLGTVMPKQAPKLGTAFDRLVEFRERRAGFNVKNLPGRVGNDTLDTLSLSICNESEQVCTDCVLVDNVIAAATFGARALQEFYTDNATGFPLLVRRFEEGMETTLVNPFGNDTYTTFPKRVPWIFERLPRVRWFWQFNYTEFIDILSGQGGTPPDFDAFVGQTQILQAQRAAQVGRADFDNDILTLTDSVIRPALEAIERAVAASVSAVSKSTLLRLYERYVECDYTGALLCRSDLGIGLFDALANIILIYIIITLLSAAILPGNVNVLSNIFAVISFLAFTYTLTLWLAYGASPLCTLNALFSGIRGVPVCFPADVYQLVDETIPQCGLVPISLIDPSELAQASRTLCSTCGTVPKLRNCAVVAGFLNGLDNVFYSLTAAFGPRPGQVLAEIYGPFIPIISTLAELYTPEYIILLGDAGLTCNYITLPNLATLGLLLLFIGAAVAVALSLIGLLLAAVGAAFLLALYAINVMIMQIDKGFVQGTRVEKLKQE